MVIILNINEVRELIQLQRWQQAAYADAGAGANAASRCPYIVQMAEITPTTVDGDVPVTLHFHDLFNRPPVGSECDILLDGPVLTDTARFLV